jgi:hypothetical protein
VQRVAEAKLSVDALGARGQQAHSESQVRLRIAAAVSNCEPLRLRRLSIHDVMVLLEKRSKTKAYLGEATHAFKYVAEKMKATSILWVLIFTKK